MRKNNLDQLNEEKPENLSPKSKSKIVLTYNVAEDLEKLLQFDRSKYRDYKSKIKVSKQTQDRNFSLWNHPQHLIYLLQLLQYINPVVSAMDDFIENPRHSLRVTIAFWNILFSILSFQENNKKCST